jgi:hypothetical protein
VHELLDEACSRLAVDLPHLSAAAEFSDKQIREARQNFKERLGFGDPLDIVVC